MEEMSVEDWYGAADSLTPADGENGCVGGEERLLVAEARCTIEGPDRLAAEDTFTVDEDKLMSNSIAGAADELMAAKGEGRFEGGTERLLVAEARSTIEDLDRLAAVDKSTVDVDRSTSNSIVGAGDELMAAKDGFEGGAERLLVAEEGSTRMDLDRLRGEDMITVSEDRL
jgi:hypothetical protein